MWTKGAFEEGCEGNLSLPALSSLEPVRQILADNTTRFAEGLPASHCLVAGPTGSGKSWLLWESTLLAGVCDPYACCIALVPIHLPHIYDDGLNLDRLRTPYQARTKVSV